MKPRDFFDARLMWAVLGVLLTMSVVVPSSVVRSAELPASTQKMLKQLNLDPAILDGVDQELKVPPEWIEQAKKEGQFTIAASDSEALFRMYTEPFAERYPFINAKYERGSFRNRVTRPLLAFKQGRHLVDLTTSITGAVKLFEEADALASLSDIPNYYMVRPEYRPDDAKWAAQDLRIWCMGYNPKKIKKEWLPKTWEELSKSGKLRGGVVAIDDRPMTWMAQLWNAWGPERSTAFLEDFFGVVQPQLRKEGISALAQLSSLGEVPLIIPAAGYRVYQIARKGGDLAWHCPEPVPVSVSEIALFRDAPNTYASKIFVNWLLSREGQLAKRAVLFTAPSHKDLPLDELVVYPKEIAGKKLAPINANKSDEQNAELQKVWNPLWQKRMQQER